MSKNLLQVKIILFLIIFLLPVAAIATAENFPFGDYSYWESVDEILDLYVDGSSTPIFVNITKEYDYISLLSVHLGFSDVSIDFDYFGDGNGTNALVNGTQLYRNGTAQFIPITNNDQLMGISRWTDIYEDDASSTGVHIHVAIDYTQLIPDYGLKITENHYSPYIMIKVQDNIQDFCNEFYIIISGRKYIEIVGEKPVSPDLVDPFVTLNIWFLWFLSMWPLWLITSIVLAVFIFILRELL